MCSLSLSVPIEAPEATRGVKALLFFLSISATASARAARRSSVLSSFLQSLHLQSGAHVPPAAKQTQYRFRQPDRSHRQRVGLPFSFSLALERLPDGRRLGASKSASSKSVTRIPSPSSWTPSVSNMPSTSSCP
jgi:hypothetical protein